MDLSGQTAFLESCITDWDLALRGLGMGGWAIA